MEKVINTIALVIFKIDTVLYKTLGFVSPLRKRSWTRKSKKLQQDLDREHLKRDRFNSVHGTEYTTKQALALQNNEL